MALFQEAQFFISADKLTDLPAPCGVEIAFAGRSNSGKSSAINTLANRNRLAFVSKTPGRTQLINFFSLGNERFLVDLPGYGYAKVPEAMRLHWQTVLSRYLMERESLYGLVLIMDARHPLTPLDRQMLNWFLPTCKPVHVLLSKADKLSKQQATATLRAVRAEIERTYPNCTVQLFSSLKRVGLEEAEKVIGKWLADGLEETGVIDNALTQQNDIGSLGE
ncbi:MAG: ribosome biogenesis GTP-binding protein YihA/YsxC [Betaproteobacteria bacterium]|nr:ribosome biogenesis GTP-binding protein YihA/YsxC [Betaproteobacteria bacterium]